MSSAGSSQPLAHPAAQTTTRASTTADDAHLPLDPAEELLDATCLERRSSSIGTLTSWQQLAAQVSDEGDGAGGPVVAVPSSRSLSWTSSCNGRNGVAPRPLAALYRDYRILESIGRGAYGNVSIAIRRSDRRQLVAKEVSLSQASMSTAKLRETILGEVEVLSRLRHPNVVRFVEFFLDASSMLVVILEHCNGGDLAGLIKKREGRLMDEASVMWLWVQIALALHYSHSNGVLHRDLKGNNVLCHNLAPGPATPSTPASRRASSSHADAAAAEACSSASPPGPAAGLLLKLADFGVARCFDADSSLAGTVVGTPQYMSPEICAGEPYGRKSDVWSLGCILYELACLRKAFEASNIGGVYRKIAAAEFAPLPDGVFSAGLTQLVGALLAKDPAARPSVAEVLDMPFVRHHLACYLDWARCVPEAAPETLLATLSTASALPRAPPPAGTGATAPSVSAPSSPALPPEPAAAPLQAAGPEAAPTAVPAAATATDAAAGMQPPAGKLKTPFASPAAALAAMPPPQLDDARAASSPTALMGGRGGLLGKKFLRLNTGGGSGGSSCSLEAWAAGHGSPQHSHEPSNSGPLIAAFRGPDGGGCCGSSGGGMSPLGSGSSEWRGSLPLELGRRHRSSTNSSGGGSGGGGMPRSPLGRQVVHSWVDDGEQAARGQPLLHDDGSTAPAATGPVSLPAASSGTREQRSSLGAAVSLPTAPAPCDDGSSSGPGWLADVLNALKQGSAPPDPVGGGSAPASFSCSSYNLNARLAQPGTQQQQQQPQAQAQAQQLAGGGGAAARRRSSALDDSKTSLQGWLREQARTTRSSVTLPKLPAGSSVAPAASEQADGSKLDAARRSWWQRISSSSMRRQAMAAQPSAAAGDGVPRAASGLSVAIPQAEEQGDAAATPAESPAAQRSAAASPTGALPPRPPQGVQRLWSASATSEDASDDETHAPVDLAAMVKHCLSGNSFLFRRGGLGGGTGTGASPTRAPSAGAAAAAAAAASGPAVAAAAAASKDGTQLEPGVLAGAAAAAGDNDADSRPPPDRDDARLAQEQMQQLAGWRAFKARLQERHPHLSSTAQQFAR